MDHGAEESEQDQAARKDVQGEQKTERLEEQGEQEFERPTESDGSRVVPAGAVLVLVPGRLTDARAWGRCAGWWVRSSARIFGAAVQAAAGAPPQTGFHQPCLESGLQSRRVNIGRAATADVHI
jgi:hypothetical protein